VLNDREDALNFLDKRWDGNRILPERQKARRVVVVVEPGSSSASEHVERSNIAAHKDRDSSRQSKLIHDPTIDMLKVIAEVTFPEWGSVVNGEALS
jgi:hypothetical protein